jgi:hypothetical protein
MTDRSGTGQWLPGKSPNAGGLTRAQQRVARMLEDMTPKAAKRLGELIESRDEAIALGAVKEWLSRMAPPPPKSAPAVNVALLAGNGAHLAALLSKAQTRIAEGQGDDALPVQAEVLSVE